MAEPSRAVFLSYASEDSEVVGRICGALRSAGIEVWFDQSELRGGDAWDRQIRKQIHDCALFVPIISVNTQARLEGYFRLEWRLAVERTHHMAEAKPFLLPLVIDDTDAQDAEVPESFRAVQWSRLPAGTASPSFVERVLRLLSPGKAPSASRTPLGAAPAPLRSTLGGPSRWKRPALVLIATVVVIGVGYFAADKFWLSRRAAVPMYAPVAQSPLPVQSEIPEKSIAVLPFVDMSEKHDQGYFGDGLAEELLDLLAQVQDLRVPARTSSFYFKGRSDDIATIAQKLRVAHILEGSVRKAGNAIRVTVQLIRADSGYHVWSRTFDADVKDVFKVQDEIANAVVATLKIRLLPTQALVNAHRSDNSDAYSQFLVGKQFYYRAANADDDRRAVAAFQQAVTLDPNYAAAYAWLAVSQANLVARSESSDATAYLEAVKNAQKAVELGPDMAETYSVRGALRAMDFDWTGAQADHEKALALNPDDSVAQRRYSKFLASQGRLPEAIAIARRAIQLDPLDLSAWGYLGDELLAAGQIAGAREALQRAVDISPTSPAPISELTTLEVLDGHPQNALARCPEISIEVRRLKCLAMAQHALGRAADSRRAVEELLKIDTAPSDYYVAQILAWSGQRTPALDALERAYTRQNYGIAATMAKIDPLLASVRGDARFKALLRKMNMPE